MIECLQLRKHYGLECELFRGATLRVRKGEFAVVSGPSGSGKTVLLRMLLALETPDGGQVLFQGKNIHAIPRRHLSSLRRKLGIVAQNGRLVPEWTLFDNVALPLLLAGKDRWLIKKKVFQALESLNLHQRANALCKGMDASESKRAEIARAAVHNPLVLLADEPLEGLEPGERSLVVALIAELNVGGTTCMAFSRDPSELLTVTGVRRAQIVHGRFQECLTA